MIKNAIKNIVESVPDNHSFDSHFVIDRLIEGYSDCYIRFSSQYIGGDSPTEITHREIGKLIKLVCEEEKLADIQEFKNFSINIHHRGSPCGLWLRNK